MAEVLTLSYLEAIDPTPIESNSVVAFTTFKDLISYLFRKGNEEKDVNHATVVVINQRFDGESSIEDLDSLSFIDKRLLLRYFFNHLNVIAIHHNQLNNSPDLNRLITNIASHISQRITRVETWTGTGFKGINDVWTFIDNEEEKFTESSFISTMSSLLSSNVNKNHITTKRLIALKDLIIKEIDFLDLLTTSQEQLSKIGEYVGHWCFPAHELSNDDLVYCVYLMIKYSLDQLPRDCGLHFPSNNELLAFVFLVRDTYRNGNPFHNFRHATDVLQACFHFLIRLDCLPVPVQMTLDPNGPEIQNLDKCKFEGLVELKSSGKYISEVSNVSPGGRRLSTFNIGHLNPIETFGLLIAAIGHDVGHPGVTNAFMTKYFAPTSLVYNGKSVLELFHSSVFINKVLSVNWPSLLDIFMDSNEKLTMRELIISCILATDMAEHFEYIGKIAMFKDDIKSSPESKVQLISSLLIKCADISNVTRPLRVSAQWALVLSREFDEVAKLEKNIIANQTSESVTEDIDLDPKYIKLPISLEKIIEAQPEIHKGQIFFIDVFAESLFKSVVGVLPELQYTCDVILSNKSYWYERRDKVNI